MRFFNNKGYPIIEIAYHPEPKINNGDKQQKILHFHVYNGLERKDAEMMNDDIKEKYSKFLKEFDLYDKC